MIDVTFHALVAWPHEATPAYERRPRGTFKATWNETLEQLEREARKLKASNLVIGCGLQPSDIRQDGWPRTNARVPGHPGVEISFDAELEHDAQARRGRFIIQRHGSVRKALAMCHPDAGGNEADFHAVQAAADRRRRLVYATDVCELWQHNVRSIALGLEALRAVDRYGISRRGQQYAGFRGALTAGASS